jgi:hypothetical protein
MMQWFKTRPFFAGNRLKILNFGLVFYDTCLKQPKRALKTVEKGNEFVQNVAFVYQNPDISAKRNFKHINKSGV